MAEFKKTSTLQFQRYGKNVSSDTLYWESLGFPVTIKEFGGIDWIDFTSSAQHNFAATSSSKVQIYNPITNEVHKTLSRFQGAAYGGTFRHDGSLLAAGSEESFVHLFDVESKAQLRVFKKHTAAVHRCQFTVDNTHIVSFSDDKTTKLWDIPTEACIQSLQEHKDYVRAGAISLASQGIFFSGSYDHTAKMFDSRQPKSVLTVSHEAPIESILVFPSGGVFITAGGTEIRVWDALAGGRMIAKLVQHNKTVTCLSFASGCQRLLSGGLDRRVNIFDVSTYQVRHTLSFSSPILSLGVSQDDEVLAVGMADGLLSVQRRQKKEPEKETKQRGKKSYTSKLKTLEYTMQTGDILVQKEANEKLKDFDRYLRRFDHTKALDTVLAVVIRDNRPELLVAVIQQLIRRGKIRQAIAGRNDRQLESLLYIIIKHIRDPYFMTVMLDLANIVIDLYSDQIKAGSNTQVLFQKLKTVIAKQINVMQEMMKLGGSIELLLAAANARNTVPRNTPS